MSNPNQTIFRRVREGAVRGPYAVLLFLDSHTSCNLPRGASDCPSAPTLDLPGCQHCQSRPEARIEPYAAWRAQETLVARCDGPPHSGSVGIMSPVVAGSSLDMTWGRIRHSRGDQCTRAPRCVETCHGSREGPARDP